MKRIEKSINRATSLFATLCFALLLGSCTNTEIDSQTPDVSDFTTVTAVVEDINFAENKNNKITIKANTPWTIDVSTTETDDSWCSLNAYSSGEIGLEAVIYITAAVNASSVDRTATITITFDGNSTPEVYEFKQTGYDASLYVSEPDLSLYYTEGATDSFYVLSTSDWSISSSSNFSFNPSEGTGDPYMSSDPELVIVTTLADNLGSSDIVEDIYITNTDGESEKIEITQQFLMGIEFTDASGITAASAGETLTIPVTTTLAEWRLLCSNDDVVISDPNYSASTVDITIGKNGSFGSRTMTLSLESTDGLTVSTSNITVTQASYNTGLFSYTAYAAGTISASTSTGYLTINHTSTLNSRMSAASSAYYTYGFGTYTIDFVSFTSNHATNPVIVMQVDSNDSAATDRFIVVFGEDPSSTSRVSVIKTCGTVLNNTFYFDGGTDADVTNCKKLVIKILPNLDDDTITISVDMNDGEVSLSQTESYSDKSFTDAQIIASDANKHNMLIYFGIGSNLAPSGTTNTAVISSFEFEPYTAE